MYGCALCGGDFYENELAEVTVRQWDGLRRIHTEERHQVCPECLFKFLRDQDEKLSELSEEDEAEAIRERRRAYAEERKEEARGCW